MAPLHLQPSDLVQSPSNSAHLKKMHPPLIPSRIIDHEDKVILGEVDNDGNPNVETHTIRHNHVKKQLNWMNDHN
ncbi:hypothetical protein Lal_00016980 [Lupinus albus]|nr:hypothetical protein Lal_00016980 [Lupinus albus]